MHMWKLLDGQEAEQGEANSDPSRAVQQTANIHKAVEEACGREQYLSSASCQPSDYRSEQTCLKTQPHLACLFIFGS